MEKTIRKILCVAALLISTPSLAALSPLGLSIVPPIQFPPSDFNVAGARVSAIYGHHRDVYGFDFGLGGNVTDLTFTGIGVSGLFNLTKGTTTAIGLQAAGVTNVNLQKTQVYGLQAALGVNYNGAESSVVGLQLAALANLSAFTTIYGVQAALYNKAREVYGIQFGLVNFATNLHGIQIGLLNFHETGLFVVSPIINVGW